jgi:hypothetical protein
MQTFPKVIDAANDITTIDTIEHNRNFQLCDFLMCRTVSNVVKVEPQ